MATAPEFSIRQGRDIMTDGILVYYNGLISLHGVVLNELRAATTLHFYQILSLIVMFVVLVFKI